MVWYLVQSEPSFVELLLQDPAVHTIIYYSSIDIYDQVIVADSWFTTTATTTQVNRYYFRPVYVPSRLGHENNKFRVPAFVT